MGRTGCVLDVLLVLAGALRFGSMSMFLGRVYEGANVLGVLLFLYCIWFD